MRFIRSRRARLAADRPERKTPIHQLAETLGLPVRTPRRLKNAEEQAAFAALGADLAVVVAYGLILPKPVLDAPRLGCLNLHGSLLPRWRGAAPIQRALMAGDTETGVQAMRMEEGLDTGPVLLSEPCRSRRTILRRTLHDRLAAVGAPLLVLAVALMETGEGRFTAQSAEGVTYAEKITPEEARIDWTRPAHEIDRKIRGLSPFPGAWFTLNGVRVKALMSRAESGDGAPGEALDDNLLIASGVRRRAVRLLRVQREGKGAMAAEDFVRGTPVPAGAMLS